MTTVTPPPYTNFPSGLITWGDLNAAQRRYVCMGLPGTTGYLPANRITTASHLQDRGVHGDGLFCIFDKAVRSKTADLANLDNVAIFRIEDTEVTFTDRQFLRWYFSEYPLVKGDDFQALSGEWKEYFSYVEATGGGINLNEVVGNLQRAELLDPGSYLSDIISCIAEIVLSEQKIRDLTDNLAKAEGDKDVVKTALDQANNELRLKKVELKLSKDTCVERSQFMQRILEALDNERQENQTLKEELSSSEASGREKSQRNEELERENAGLAQRITDQDQRIAELYNINVAQNQRNAEWDQRIAEQDQRIADQERRIADQDNRIADRDKTIAELNERSTALRQTNTALSRTNVELTEKNAEIAKEIAELRQEADRLESLAQEQQNARQTDPRATRYDQLRGDMPRYALRGAGASSIAFCFFPVSLPLAGLTLVSGALGGVGARALLELCTPPTENPEPNNPAPEA